MGSPGPPMQLNIFRVKLPFEGRTKKAAWLTCGSLLAASCYSQKC
jgi:hypothetical protein